MIQRRLFIEGLVQGVGFRAFVKRIASEFPNLRGYVRNLQDGRVEVLIAAQQSEVSALIALCQTGPPYSKVQNIEIIEESVDQNLPKFKLIR